MEVATSGAPAAAPTAPAPQPAAAPSTATPQAAPSAAPSTPPAWFNDFKNEETKSFIQDRKFSNAEQLAQSYVNLEKMKGVPEDRLLKLPEKMEGDEMKAVFQKLGAPKEAKEYDLPADHKLAGPEFNEWAGETFLKNNLTKTQAQNVVKGLSEFVAAQNKTQAEAHQNAVLQADTKLKQEWGGQYDQNINMAKQGAKILGLDVKSLDIMEALQGRDVLLKNLQRIGVSVGESSFVDGGTAAAPTQTAEDAQAEINRLIKDKEFGKKVAAQDTEALKKWNELNKLAAPGQKQIG